MTNFLKEAGYSRIPVYDGDEDNIIGVLHTRDVVLNTDTKKSIKDFIRRDSQLGSAKISLKYEDVSFRFMLSNNSESNFSYDGELADIPIPARPIYLPPKEFLSINAGFIAAYKERELSYNETYYDLALALNALPLRENKLSGVKSSIKLLEKIITGNSSPKDNIIKQENGTFYFDLPEGISASIEKNNIIKLSGIDKEKLGHTAAAIRRTRPPEPYKGKGIKYAEERIKRKAGKTGAK